MTRHELMAVNQSAKRRVTANVLDVPVDAIDWDEALDRIFEWAKARESRVVCICSVHSVVTARQNQAHAQSLRSADMVTPDGAPVAWTVKAKGHPDQKRISGPDLMPKACQRAAETGEKIFLYGGSPTSLALLEDALRQRFPGLDIAGSISPPFRALTDEEDAAIVEEINNSGAGIVWVGLGCPKQEAWMQSHRGRINAVMVGVGAAFDFHAGVIKRAPVWMQRSGLEWVHRMSQDPRRLVKRYLVTNTIFVIATLQDFLLPKWSMRAPGRVRKTAD
jgi:N-acetylglucosaminyldiphosphoundecaprenol N-acetyl-beta-D-mannosaminyltransferase